MLSKLKNVAKTMEGRSKSHFSHILNEVEKTPPRPSILERFSRENRPKIEEKSFRNRYEKSYKFQQVSTLIFLFILDFQNYLQDVSARCLASFFCIWILWILWNPLEQLGRPASFLELPTVLCKMYLAVAVLWSKSANFRWV